MERIADAVTNIFQRALQLEEDGILGAGLTVTSVNECNSQECAVSQFTIFSQGIYKAHDSNNRGKHGEAFMRRCPLEVLAPSDRW